MDAGFISNEKFGRLVFNELLPVCHKWARDKIPEGVEDPVPAEVTVHAIKNTRRKMEDMHVTLPFFGKLFHGIVSFAHFSL